MRIDQIAVVIVGRPDCRMGRVELDTSETVEIGSFLGWRPPPPPSSAK